MWQSMKELASVILGLTMIVVLVLLFVGTPIYFVSKYQCSGYAKTLGFEHKYSLSTRCVIKTQLGWIDRNKYVITKEEK